jgi:phosphate transport system substrate-binding protein
MKTKLLLCTSAFAFACQSSSAVTQQVKIDGSSTVYLVSEAAAEEYRAIKKEVQVSVGTSGTGGGFKKFCAGEIDIADASRPIKTSEVELCKKNNVDFIELPIAYDGIAIVVNPKNDWAKDITVDELKKLWEPEAQKTITTWKQVRDSWPDQPINLFGAGVDSGTYDYFTEAIVKKAKSSRGDYTASEDDNVLVTGVSKDVNALGFFGYAYYSENKDKLAVLPVNDGKAENGDGPIAPDPETIKKNTYQPLSRPLFIYIAVKSIEKTEVKDFIEYYIKNAPKLTAEVGYIPLPDKAYEFAKKRVDTKKTGSMFQEGSQVGASIEDILAKEAAQ